MLSKYSLLLKAKTLDASSLVAVREHLSSTATVKTILHGDIKPHHVFVNETKNETQISITDAAATESTEQQEVRVEYETLVRLGDFKWVTWGSPAIDAVRYI